MNKAVIIGAGFGGLALGLRLQSAGVATTIVEGRDQPGGRAWAWRAEGFTFDAGPALITDPDGLAQLWRLSGHEMTDDVTLLPVDPHYRFHWADGTTFDHAADETRLRAEIARFSPADLAGYQRFLDYSASVRREAYEALAPAACQTAGTLLRAAPMLAQYQAWRSVHAMIGRFVKDERLRQALSFPSLFTGTNPATASALHASLHALERSGGLWFPKGGTHALVAAMAAQFERLGGTMHLNDPVVGIETVGDRATSVTTRAGLRIEGDAVASNADIMHSYADLLAGHKRGPHRAQSLTHKHWGPGAFLLHFGIEGSWPGIPHSMVLLGARYREWLTDIFDHGVLPADSCIILHHPSVTDPSLAPAGHSTFQAIVPVPHLGKLPVDWSAVEPILATRILDEIERRLIPDIRGRIKVQASYTPPDFARDFHAHHGSAFGLEPVLSQSGWLRPHNRDDVIGNLYFVGADTHPGGGIPGVVASARATATLMLADRA